MCGLVAFYQTQPLVDSELLQRMADSMAHRGPDDRGFFMKGPVGLGFRRLSIVDIRDGHQPMSNEDETVSIVFNGEIYNHLQWRTALEIKGTRFRTDHSDTETLLRLYEQDGIDCVHKLNGMFAFVVWDQKRNRLFAARDRLGVKPLYYVQLPGAVLLASEIKALLCCPHVQRAVDPVALYQYLALRYVPAPRTLFQGIYKLPAGHRLWVENGRVHSEPYWDLPWTAQVETLPERPWAETYLDLLDDAVRMRLLSDVPLGAFLSGGLDSTTLVALMKRHLSDPPHTFSIGFGDQPGASESWDERPFSRLASKALQTLHQEIVVDSTVCAHLRKLVWHMDEPLADPAALPTYILSVGTRQHVTVALSGEGSDETLGGYGKYAFPYYEHELAPIFRLIKPRWILDVLAMLPVSPLQRRRIEKFLRTLDAPPGATQTLLLLGALDPETVDALLSNDAHKTLGRNATLALFDDQPKSAPSLDPLNRLLHLEIKTYLAEQLLMKVDKMSMAASLEVRVPFLDYRLVELSTRIPPSLKVHGRATKVLLKEATRGLVPEAIRTRKKQGFSVPVETWFRGPLRKEVESLVDFAEHEGLAFLDAGGVGRLLRRHLHERDYCGQEIWSLLVLKEWHDVFIQQPQHRLHEIAS